MATPTLSISFRKSNENCDIFIEEGILGRIPQQLFSDCSSVAVISDDLVSKIYAKKLSIRSKQIHLVSFPHGENIKSLDTASALASKLSDLGMDRNSAIIALGGGVTGDLAGFVASIFKRGLRYFQAPTTLLAQVDSSIGGKTGVDTGWGKNQLGTFYQPEAVFIDPSVLTTLPQSEIINGLGEMVKSGIISDSKLFDSIYPLDSLSLSNLKPMIIPTCRIKAKIVQGDEKETNLRSVLNYGHTVAHALEASADYKLAHGKAVILGMIAEGWIASELGILEKKSYERQTELLKRITRSFRVRAKFDPRKILEFAKLDKKAMGATIRMSLPEKIGKMHVEEDGRYTVEVKKDLFLNSLQHLKAEV